MCSERLALMKINHELCQQLQDSLDKMKEVVKLFPQGNPRRMIFRFVLDD